jgi:class 3 adenylate cyclase/tetratricopeptide (TPR) repeat protein
MDIGDWLRGLGFGEYAEAFAKNGVDPSILAELTNDDLKDLGVARLADRRTILKAITQLSDAPAKGLPPPRVAGERRQVTVLFADLAGFTRLSAQIGAEEVHALLNRYFELVDRIIGTYGGHVDKHIGDNVMAVFGAPIAHDDDPMRAVLAAIEIHDQMGTLPAPLGGQLQAHIGIASGQVVASGTGSEAHSEYTVTGEAVNLASRLQGHAAPGETLISDSSFRSVADRIDCEALGELAVKGLEAPVQVWQVRSLHQADEGRARATFVGRHAELAQFSGAAETCRTAGIGQTIIVRGEAGIGKTRLVEEFTKICADKGFTSHKGLVLDFGVGKGQDAIRSVVRSLLGIAPGSSETVRQAAAETAIAERLLASDQRVFLNDLLDLSQAVDERAIFEAMSNAKRNDGKRGVVGQLIHASSKLGPVLIAIEDVHWADPLMLTYLAGMAATVAECRALLILTSRIEGDPLDQTWRATTAGCPLISIDLAPLRKKEALALAGAFIDATSQFTLDCIERAEGNPLFLEQLLRDAKERGEEDVPASIQSIVLARMDRLRPKDKQALQAAAVIGQRFALDTLRCLIDDASYRCDEMVRHYLMRPDGDDFLFAHALIQESVYSSLLKAKKQELHLRAAAWFADRDSTLWAQHLDRAGDPGASRAYVSASRAQALGYHLERALALAKRGLALAGDKADRFAAAIQLGELLHDNGEPQASLGQFEAALEVASSDTERSQALIGMAADFRIVDRIDDAFAALAQAEPMAQRAERALDLARIHHLRGNLYFPLGKLENCLAEHEKVLQFAEACGSAEYTARALGGLGDAYYALGRMATAHRYLDRCIDLCRAHGFASIEMSYLYMRSDTHYYQAKLTEGFADCQKAIEMAAAVGNRRAEFFGRWSLILLYNLEWNRRPDAATKQSLATGQDIVERLGLRRCEPLIIMARCSVAVLDEQPIDVDAELRKGYAICQETGVTFAGPWLLSLLLHLTQDPETRDWALNEGQRVLSEQVCVSHNYIYFYRYAMDSLLAAHLWDQVEQYASRLEEYTRPEPLPICDFFIRRGRALAAFGRGQRGLDLVHEIRLLRDEAERLSLNSDLPALQEALDTAAELKGQPLCGGAGGN